MICGNCGYENDGYSEYCANCGVSLANGGYTGYNTNSYVQPAKNGSGMGIASMVLGIVSLVFPGGFLAIPVVGLILGIVSFKNAKQEGRKDGFAVAGLVTSSIALGLLLISTLFIAFIVILSVIYSALIVFLASGSMVGYYY